LESQATLNNIACSFNAALECMGDAARDVIYNTLERNGIRVQDVPLRIPEAVMIIRKTLGSTAGLIVHRMIAEFRAKRFNARTGFHPDDYFLA
jgi:hypothetical protein